MIGMSSPGMIPTSQMYGMGNPGMVAEGLMGSGMSRMAASGPLLGGAAALFGLDPFGLAMRAGWGAFQGGAGVAGIGMAGMGAFGLASAGAAGIGFLGQQMMQGAGSSMALNNALRQNFNFMGPQGQGFGRGDMTAIGQNLHSMTHMMGPGGEMTGFSELSRLASNMGRMGLSTGVRDAQEFTRRFKEMVSTLKTVATELGTSLESAQELLTASKNSGIFKTADQLKYAGTVRNLGLSGGLATSELTAMGNIGSQIARQFGGLGRQGTFAGMRALGQIGSATQLGTLSEEDIYNATGLGGAEGRQALASEMLQTSGRFLRSGKGRYFLASVAGKDGSLDMDAVNQYLTGGGMTVEETRERAQKNLSGIGRANFIRNEGRLRGATMEQFGGLAPALALTGWAREHKVNIQNMDDYSMLFAQRQLGMGRDELEATVKLAQGLPDIMRQQRDVARSDEYLQGVSQFRKSRSIQTRLEQIREKVQGTIQKVGTDLFQTGSDFIEGAMNRLLDQYDTYTSTNLQDVVRQAHSGSAGATRFARTIGVPAGFLGLGSEQIARATSRVQALGGYVQGNSSAAAEGARIGRMVSAANNGINGFETAHYASAHKTALLQAYADRVGGAQGDNRIAAVQRHLAGAAAQGDKGAEAILSQMRAGPEAAAGIVGNLERHLEISKESQLASTYTRPSPFGEQGGYASEADQRRAFGSAMSGITSQGILDREGTLSWTGVKAAGGWLAGMAAHSATSITEHVGWSLGRHNRTLGQSEQRANQAFWDIYNPVLNVATQNTKGGELTAAMARAFDKEATRTFALDIAEGKDPKAALRRMTDLASKGTNRTMDETGELVFLKQAQFATRYAQLQRDGDHNGIVWLANEAQNDPVLKEYVGSNGVSIRNLEEWRMGFAGMVGAQAEMHAKKLSGQLSSEGMHDFAYFKEKGVGILEQDSKTGKWKLSSATKKDLAKMEDAKRGRQAAELAIKLTFEKERVGGLEGEDRARVLGGILGQGGLDEQLENTLAPMSVNDLRKFSSKYAGSGPGDRAQDILGVRTRWQGISNAKGGNLGATSATYLGLDLGKEGERQLQGKSPQELAAFFGNKLGLKDSQRDELTNALKHIKAGKTGSSWELDKVRQGLSDEQKAKLPNSGKNPQEEMVQYTKESSQYLRALVESNKDAVTRLGGISVELAKRAPGNPETVGSK